MDALTTKGPTMKGKVYFMGVSRGDGELLAAEAVRVLRSAEVVLHEMPRSRRRFWI